MLFYISFYYLDKLNYEFYPKPKTWYEYYDIKLYLFPIFAEALWFSLTLLLFHRLKNYKFHRAITLVSAISSYVIFIFNGRYDGFPSKFIAIVFVGSVILFMSSFVTFYKKYMEKSRILRFLSKYLGKL